MPAAMSSSESITVSIVSHGQQALILPLLEQLRQHCAAWIAQVVLTTNIPEPDQCSATNWPFPLVHIVNTSPRGFGSNHNAAFRHCATPWFLVLNPDIRINEDVLGQLLELGQASDGILTPRIMEPEKSAPEPHRGMLTPREVLLRHRAGYQSPAQPAWVPGMFMLFRTRAFESIDGFDERFFMYGEDFDICARLRLAGWQIHAAEHLHALHAAQRASRRNWRHLRWHITSLSLVWLSRTFWRYRSLYRAQCDKR